MNEKLTMDELQYVQNEVKLKGKNLGLSYASLVFFGLLGVHYAYLEKGKIALMRIMLTFITLISLYPIKGIVYQSETEGLTIKLQMYSSSLLVLHVALFALIIAWTLYDFVKLPTMIRLNNEKKEKEAKEKALQARNVIARIREEEISKIMIEKISSNLEKEIKTHSEEIVRDFSKKVEELNESNSKIQKEIIQQTKNNDVQKDPIIVDGVPTIENEEITTVEKEITTAEENLTNVNEEFTAVEENITTVEEETTTVNEDPVVTEDNPIIENYNPIIADEYAITAENHTTTANKNSVTVDEALTKKNGQFAVKGYIIGCLNSKGQEISTNENNSNLLIANNSNESDLDKTLIIQIHPELQKQFGLQSNPDLIGIPIIADGRIKNYYGRKGLKNISQIKIEK